jgi:hypothetical protein
MPPAMAYSYLIRLYSLGYLDFGTPAQMKAFMDTIYNQHGKELRTSGEVFDLIVKPKHISGEIFLGSNKKTIHNIGILKQKINKIPKTKTVYEALNFPEIYPLLDQDRNNSIIDCTFIYDFLHLGWTKQEINKFILERYDLNDGDIVLSRMRQIAHTLDFKSFDKGEGKSLHKDVVYQINSGVKALREIVKSELHFQNRLSLTSVQFETNDDKDAKIDLRRKKIMMLTLNGASEKTVMEVIPDITQSSVFNDLRILKNKVRQIYPKDYSDYLRSKSYKQTAITYSILLKLYSERQLDFGHSEEMQQFRHSVESRYGRKIYTPDEVNNLIINPSIN